MKITYGTTREKAFLCGAFLLAATTSALILLWEQLFSFPYLALPLYLGLCALVLACLPTGQPSGDLLSRGLYRALPALFLMSAIYYASSFTFLKSPSFGFDRSDLLFHFSEFFALGLLTARMVAPDIYRRHSLRSFPSGLFHRPGIRSPGRDPPGLRAGKELGRVGLARRRLEWALRNPGLPGSVQGGEPEETGGVANGRATRARRASNQPRGSNLHISKTPPSPSS